MEGAERRPHEATLLRVEPLAPDTRAFHLERPPGLDFAPGQFLSFLLPVGEATLTRAYTIASAPEDPGPLEIVLNQVPEGPGSTWWFGLEPGAVLRFTGPWGAFRLDEPPAEETVFLADGVGVAAVRPMLRRCLASAGTAPLRLHHVVSDPARQLFAEEFRQAARRHPRFTYEACIGGDLRRIATERYIEADDNRQRRFFVCGVGEVVPATRDLLRGAGYERRSVQYEKW